MLITDITMIEFEEGLKHTRTIILPFGSIEEHGPHLPLGTDTMQMYEIARMVAKKYPVFVGPPVFYGLCRSTREHPGTISISGQTLRGLVLDMLFSYYHQGLRNFLLFSGHAGGTHLSFILDAAEEFLEKTKDTRLAVASILDLLNMSAADMLETPKDSHAGEFETSLMLYFFPDLVKGTAPEEYPSFPKPFLVRNKRKFWPGGVWGNPAKASAYKGKLFAEKLSDFIIELIEKIENIEEDKT
ncbi:creatininase family protein [Thermodesulfatator autotrophicus]|uniref:Creatinine amidohydrolase n=1 Tax=Thermodesulfatator autotrophicus TaxID=1795632 RepID=A0A177E6K3_9BACT|nr:creatininase family protein [Thermodesulfatator autotrophicus]OAG27593.1 creatinine amidohydrolase [Thermodesulfatator autotrophicus]